MVSSQKSIKGSTLICKSIIARFISTVSIAPDIISTLYITFYHFLNAPIVTNTNVHLLTIAMFHQHQFFNIAISHHIFLVLSKTSITEKSGMVLKVPNITKLKPINVHLPHGADQGQKMCIGGPSSRPKRF